MTTIAYRDGVLAADTQITVSGTNDGEVTKIARRGPILAGAAGSLPLALAFLDWFKTGLDPDRAPKMQGPEKEDYASGKLFLPDGRIMTYDELGWSVRKKEFYAFGSGGDFAEGAMAMGASAEDAVRVAMRFDSGTGGEVQTLRA